MGVMCHLEFVEADPIFPEILVYPVRSGSIYDFDGTARRVVDMREESHGARSRDQFGCLSRPDGARQGKTPAEF